LKHIIRTVLLTVFGLAAIAPQARADGWVSPFAGVNFGGSAGGKLGDVADDPSHFTWGVDVGGMLGGIFGAELDVAYAKNFFGSSDIGDNSILTIVPTAIVGIPIGGQHGAGIRPFVSGGIGLLRRNLDVSNISVFDDNKAVYTLGAGVMGYFGDHFGVRADYRYFRAFSVDDLNITSIDLNKDTFNYSRFTLGAIFRF